MAYVITENTSQKSGNEVTYIQKYVTATTLFDQISVFRRCVTLYKMQSCQNVLQSVRKVLDKNGLWNRLTENIIVHYDSSRTV